jgi:thioredoxin-related protein
MLTFKKIALLVGAVALLAGSAVAGDHTPITSFKVAKMTAEEQGLPMLLKVGKAFCKSCNAFDKEVQASEEFRATIDKHVVLCAIDATKGEGVDLAKMYSIDEYAVPTFILANSHGEVMDRWSGYHGEEYFTKHLTAAMENPITVKERMVRFQDHPNEIDARKLGEIRYFEGYLAEAVAFYRRAQALNPSSETHYDLMILNAMGKASHDQLFAYADVKKQADIAVASSDIKPKHLLKVAGMMNKVAKDAGDLAYFTPYLKQAIERTKGIEDEDVQKGRANLMPEYALLVKKNERKAVTLKKELFAQYAEPKDWLENANLLNNFAWWCFEMEINLDEAEQFARKGIELAEAGRQKGNILDTLAEICNMKGDCGEAVDYIRLAVAEDPEYDYFQKQLVRFEKLLAETTD